jgi:hypothetical protein
VEWSYYIHAIFFQLATDANAASRQVGIRLFHHTGAPGTIWEGFYTTAQTATQTFRYCFAPGAGDMVNFQGGGNRFVGVPRMPMNGNLRMAIKVNFTQVGDQLSSIWVHFSIFVPSGYKVNFPIPV